MNKVFRLIKRALGNNRTKSAMSIERRYGVSTWRLDVSKYITEIEQAHLQIEEDLRSRRGADLKQLMKKEPASFELVRICVAPSDPPAGQEYVDPFLFETGYFESREEYEEVSRKAKIKSRARA